MPPSPNALDADWLGACRGAADDIRALLRERPAAADRIEETGTTGGGGDRTLVIDAAAEDAVFKQLDALAGTGVAFHAVSEERGEVSFGDSGIRVVIDPIDGSSNAKRGLAAHALSIAVADGPTMADVAFGYVFDLGTGEEWVARRGEGVLLDGRPMPEPLPECKNERNQLEIVAIESADPRWVGATIEPLADVAYRLRALGAIAVSLCQLAAGRVDGMLTLWRCRAVDAAAAQLIVREAGSFVAFPAFADPLGAPLDLEPHSAVVAARTRESLERLARIPA